MPHDERADLYSLGVLTWLLFTGGMPGSQPPVQPRPEADEMHWLRLAQREVCWFTRPGFGSIPYISLHDHLIHRAGAPASLRLAVTEEVSGRFWAETDLADPGRLMVKWFEKTSGDVTPQNLKTESIIHSRRLALLSQLWRIIVGFTWVYCTAWAMMGPQPVIYHDIPMKISYHHIIIQYIILIFQSNLSIIIHLSFSIHSTGLEALESLRITSLPSRVSPPATWPSKQPKLGTVAR